MILDRPHRRNKIGHMASLADQIRAALVDVSETNTEISRRTGVHRVNLVQFRSGTRDLPLKSLEALLEFLDFEIALIPRRSRQPKRPTSK